MLKGVLGEDHSNILSSASNLAAQLRAPWAQRMAQVLIATHLDEVRAALAAVGVELGNDAYLFSYDPAHGRPWNPDWATHRSLTRMVRLSWFMAAHRTWSAPGWGWAGTAGSGAGSWLACPARKAATSAVQAVTAWCPAWAEARVGQRHCRW